MKKNQFRDKSVPYFKKKTFILNLTICIGVTLEAQRASAPAASLFLLLAANSALKKNAVNLKITKPKVFQNNPSAGAKNAVPVEKKIKNQPTTNQALTNVNKIDFQKP